MVSEERFGLSSLAVLGVTSVEEEAVFAGDATGGSGAGALSFPFEGLSRDAAGALSLIESVDFTGPPSGGLRATRVFFGIVGDIEAVDRTDATEGDLAVIGPRFTPLSRVAGFLTLAVVLITEVVEAADARRGRMAGLVDATDVRTLAVDTEDETEGRRTRSVASPARSDLALLNVDELSLVVGRDTDEDVRDVAVDGTRIEGTDGVVRVDDGFRIVEARERTDETDAVEFLEEEAVDDLTETTDDLTEAVVDLIDAAEDFGRSSGAAFGGLGIGVCYPFTVDEEPAVEEIAGAIELEGSPGASSNTVVGLALVTKDDAVRAMDVVLDGVSLESGRGPSEGLMRRGMDTEIVLACDATECVLRATDRIELADDCTVSRREDETCCFAMLQLRTLVRSECTPIDSWSASPFPVFVERGPVRVGDPHVDGGEDDGARSSAFNPMSKIASVRQSVTHERRIVAHRQQSRSTPILERHRNHLPAARLPTAAESTEPSRPAFVPPARECVTLRTASPQRDQQHAFASGYNRRASVASTTKMKDNC